MLPTELPSAGENYAPIQIVAAFRTAGRKLSPVVTLHSVWLNDWATVLESVKDLDVRYILFPFLLLDRTVILVSIDFYSRCKNVDSETVQLNKWACKMGTTVDER